jgi:hypothetical protein
MSYYCLESLDNKSEDNTQCAITRAISNTVMPGDILQQPLQLFGADMRPSQHDATTFPSKGRSSSPALSPERQVKWQGRRAHYAHPHSMLSFPDIEKESKYLISESKGSLSPNSKSQHLRSSTSPSEYGYDSQGPSFSRCSPGPQNMWIRCGTRGNPTTTPPFAAQSASRATFRSSPTLSGVCSFPPLPPSAIESNLHGDTREAPPPHQGQLSFSNVTGRGHGRSMSPAMYSSASPLLVGVQAPFFTDSPNRYVHPHSVFTLHKRRSRGSNESLSPKLFLDRGAVDSVRSKEWRESVEHSSALFDEATTRKSQV